MTRARWVKIAAGKQWQATLARCECGGYAFPHRRGSGACVASAYSDYHRALQQGAALAEAQQLLSADALDLHFPLKDPQ